ncbi:sulfurtransferase [Fontibacter flavus]|uniref:Sulfurtransferase n=1 Tax=Fontibacter flavus TaxID=654838 RepID=A0ABV6FTM2_9BACT
MASQIFPLIKVEDCLALLEQHKIVLIDACNSSGNLSGQKYLENHLRSALFVDLNAQLSNIKEDYADGGRHPLPSPETFASLLGDLGISPDSHVVVYDDARGGNAAARFWWMMRALGHEKVQVLDGGIQAALDAGFPTSSGEEVAKKKGDYKADQWLLPTVSLQQMDQIIHEKNYVIIDVREEGRYLGEFEPIDLVAGHIPSSINIPFKSNLQENGCYLSPEQLREKYQNRLKGLDPSKVIVHCGSGVTACHTILAMAVAGLEIPTLYVGSWSEWSRNGREIVKEITT